MVGPSGEEARFDSLYRSHHREILAYFLRRMPGPDAEDATAEVFAVAWRRLDAIPAGGEAVGWLFGVAHNALSSHRRGRRRRLRLNEKLGGLATPAAPTPEHQVVRSEKDEAMLQALAGIRRSSAEILRLSAWEQLSHHQIGGILGISEAAVGQRIARARKQLRRELDRLESKQGLRVSLRNRTEGGGT